MLMKVGVVSDRAAVSRGRWYLRRSRRRWWRWRGGMWWQRNRGNWTGNARGGRRRFHGDRTRLGYCGRVAADARSHSARDEQVKIRWVSGVGRRLPVVTVPRSAHVGSMRSVRAGESCKPPECRLKSRCAQKSCVFLRGSA
eukprot:1338294-Pleurochrysis_carterae.AAC.1